MDLPRLSLTLLLVFQVSYSENFYFLNSIIKTILAFQAMFMILAVQFVADLIELHFQAGCWTPQYQSNWFAQLGLCAKGTGEQFKLRHLCITCCRACLKYSELWGQQALQLCIF